MRKQMVCLFLAAGFAALSGCKGVAVSSAVSSSPASLAESQVASSGIGSESVTSQVSFDGKSITYKATNMTTKDWFNFESKPDSTTKISMKVPKEWVMDNSIFQVNYIKQAEIVGVITLGEGQDVPSGQIVTTDTQDPYEPDQFVSEETGTIAGLSFTMQETISYPDGGDISVWYPYTYYLSDGNRVFVVTFYSLKSNSTEDEALYKSILATFKFEE